MYLRNDEKLLSILSNLQTNFIRRDFSKKWQTYRASIVNKMTVILAVAARCFGALSRV